MEGDAASPDRRVFINLFPDQADQIRFIPINSSDNALRINRAVLAILGETLGYSEFFLIRDRDYLSQASVEKYQTGSDRIFILQQHEIENYLLDPFCIAAVCNSLLPVPVDVTKVEAELLSVAVALAGRVLKETVTARINSFFQLEDCSIGAFGNDQGWLSENREWRVELIEGARTRFASRIAEVAQSITTRTTEAQVQEIVTAAAAEIRSALGDGTWRRLFPGKELLDRLAKKLGFHDVTILANATIRELAEHPERIDTELSDIVKRIASAPTGHPTAPATSN